MFANRQVEAETTADALLTFGPHDPTVGFDELSGDGEAEAGAAGGAVAGRVNTVEAIEDVVETLRWDAGSGVSDLDTNGVARSLRGKGYGAAGGSVSDCVVEEIAEDLSDAKRIDRHVGQAVGNLGLQLD